MSTIHGTEQLAHELGSLTADLLTQVALPVLINANAFTSERWSSVSRNYLGCLMGIVRAEEHTAAVGQSVLDVFTNEPGLSSDPDSTRTTVRW